MENDYDEYFDYLNKRSILGLLYRKYWLYPFINLHLKGKVLDVGCGIGDFLRFRNGTYGTDINPNVVAFCHKYGQNVTLMEKNILPYSAREFDGIVLDNVLEHIDQPILLLKEIHRVLRPNGRLIIGVPGCKGFESDADHKIFYDAKKLKSTVEQIGFDWIETYPMPLPIDALQKYLRCFAWYGIFNKKS
jgi:SAM-dependent methyltransferase